MLMATGNEFGIAVCRILDEWQALQIAVDNGLGGVNSKEKAEWLKEVTVAHFIDNKTSYVCEDDMEYFLSSIMDQEFDTIVDDGSIPKVAKELCDHWRTCFINESNSICHEECQSRPARSSGEVSHGEKTNEVVSGQHSTSSESPLQDCDGWTLVKRRR